MGDLRFQVPNPEKYDKRIWETAYITGIEGIPWYCRRQLEGNQFSIGRDIEESGKLNIVWPTQTLGNLCLATTSLRVVDQPYSLVLELARGTVYRLKNQWAEWQRIGLKLPSDFFPIAEQALTEFLRAATTRDDPRAQEVRAQTAIDKAIQAAAIMCDAYSSQVLEVRQQNEGRYSTLLGCRLQPEIDLKSVQDALKTAFNLTAIDADLNSVESTSGTRNYELVDRQLAWAQANGQRVCLGPLVNFRPGGLPRWMVLLNESFETIQRTACQHVFETVDRFRGKVHLWNCAAGLNMPSEMGWSEEESLKMSVSLIESIRQSDDRTPILLTIDQPWSEYMGNERDAISPLHFADALIRADLGLSGLALQLDFDKWPNGSLPRDPIEVSRLIDRWGILQLPLLLLVTHPSQWSNGASRASVSSWSGGAGATGNPGFMSEALLRMLLAKPTVHAIIWNQATDQTSNALPHAGLWDEQGKPKPLLHAAAKLRQTYLH